MHRLKPTILKYRCGSFIYLAEQAAPSFTTGIPSTFDLGKGHFYQFLRGHFQTI